MRRGEAICMRDSRQKSQDKFREKPPDKNRDKLREAGTCNGKLPMKHRNSPAR